MPAIKYLHFNGRSTDIGYDKDPNKCPYCHTKITPRKYNGYLNRSALEIIYVCSNDECQRTFIGIFEKTNNSYYFKKTTMGTHKPRVFSENIQELSSNFVEIYNQALTSENYNLAHISGIGYRKSLEFLIKDYLIKKHPDKTENIKSKFLGKCIKDDVDNQNLKDIAERAAWLGNDETHYVRKWESKDINDLKKLIDVSIHWIEMELLTEQYKSEME
ncbi:uncharacterized protein DUF4145 [Tenacibaculum lutimaris]|uniref:Uncharacterized protein DUF4145 n=1 Tax=Tenacibaculum lutimaris TaxID=285258 RepID=A0A420E2A9_9FLAO|nr:DUF4145 domain-containing protein [Tenacibaculum lutimaris]RKF04043.1 uncharacterized protein DUF4145 [Tenacibaculum lutimaris]